MDANKTYMTVEREAIQIAFAKAHRGACDESLPRDVARRFKEIAAAIWKACGENQAMPTRLPSGFPGTEAPRV